MAVATTEQCDTYHFGQPFYTGESCKKFYMNGTQNSQQVRVAIVGLLTLYVVYTVIWSKE